MWKKKCLNNSASFIFSSHVNRENASHFYPDVYLPCLYSKIIKTTNIHKIHAQDHFTNNSKYFALSISSVRQQHGAWYIYQIKRCLKRIRRYRRYNIGQNHLHHFSCLACYVENVAQCTVNTYSLLKRAQRTCILLARVHNTLSRNILFVVSTLF